MSSSKLIGGSRFKPFNASTFNSEFKQYEYKHVPQPNALDFFLRWKEHIYKKQKTNILFRFLPSIDYIAILKIQPLSYLFSTVTTVIFPSFCVCLDIL